MQNIADGGGKEGNERKQIYNFWFQECKSVKLLTKSTGVPAKADGLYKARIFFMRD